MAVAFTIGDYGYVGTGVTINGAGKDFWRYDPSTDVWSEIESIPTHGRKGGIGFSINDCGYVGGGVCELGSVKDFWEYNSSTSEWTQKTDIPSSVHGDNVLTGFSINEHGYLLNCFLEPNFHEYDPINDVWHPRAKFPGNGRLDMIGFSIGSHGYVGTGYGVGYENTAEFWEYDPVFDKWTRKADVPGPTRHRAVGFSIGDKGYIGSGTSRGTPLFDYWEYNPGTDSWAEITSCEFFHNGAIGLSIGSKGYVGTGHVYVGNSNFWEYTPPTSSIDQATIPKPPTLYPNPVRDRLYINGLLDGLNEYSCYSIHRSLVKYGVISNQSISVENLPVGVYVLEIRDGKNYWRLKFLKE